MLPAISGRCVSSAKCPVGSNSTRRGFRLIEFYQVWEAKGFYNLVEAWPGSTLSVSAAKKAK
jgi:hypothetical protein